MAELAIDNTPLTAAVNTVVNIPGLGFFRKREPWCIEVGERVTINIPNGSKLTWSAEVDRSELLHATAEHDQQEESNSTPDFMTEALFGALDSAMTQRPVGQRRDFGMGPIGGRHTVSPFRGDGTFVGTPQNLRGVASGPVSRNPMNIGYATPHFTPQRKILAHLILNGLEEGDTKVVVRNGKASFNVSANIRKSCGDRNLLAPTKRV